MSACSKYMSMHKGGGMELSPLLQENRYETEKKIEPKKKSWLRGRQDQMQRSVNSFVAKHACNMN